MYTYPEYLNACERVARDLMTRAHETDPVKFPYHQGNVRLRVAADSMTGTASVDWEVYYGILRVTINMPVKPSTYVVSEAEFAQGVAYLLHEVGHPLHTDKAVWNTAVRDKRQRMLNALEDVREEKATIDLGLAVNAQSMFASLIDSLHAKAIAEGYDPNQLCSLGWTLSLMGRKANGYAVDTSDVARRLDPQGAVCAILAWALPALRQCQSTQDCLDLADKVTAAAWAASKPEPRLPAPADSEAAGEANGGEGASEAGESENASGEAPTGESETETESEGESESFAPQGEASSGEGEREDKAGVGAPAGAKGSSEPQEPPPPPADQIFDKIDLTPNKVDVVTSSDSDFMVTREVLDIIREALSQPIAEKPINGRRVDVWGGMDTVSHVTGNASRMGRQRALLASALKREETDDYEGGRLSGRLDRRAMSRLVTGNPHVFGKRVLAEGYDTDVQILVDGSSSMQDDRILAAASLALVVAQAAAQVGVDCTAQVFNDKGLHTMTSGRAKPLGNKFAYAYNQTFGGTPLTESMVAVALQQRKRAGAKRRVLFVITDGGCNHGPAVVRAAGRYVEGTLGTEIANLHIGRSAMGVFRNECAVNVDKVETTGLQRFTQTLERGR